jgi:hypothetical protein
MKKKLFRALLFVSLFMSPIVSAGSRDFLFHQGIATDTAGDPLEGNLNVTFRLYEEATGGTALWEESQLINFVNGVYLTELGSDEPFPSGLFEKESLFLGIQIEGDSEMTPRFEIRSVPFAQQAETAVTALSLAEDAVIAAGSIDAAELAASGVVAGTYTLATITVDEDGRVTSASSGSAGSGGGGDITGVTAGTGLSGGGTSGDVTLTAVLGDSIDSSEITDGTITNADINAAAAIADTKLATISTAGKVADSALSSSVSLLGSSIESSEIADGTIVDADVSGTAAIAWTKVSKSGAVASDVGAASAAHVHAAGDITSGELSDARVSDTLTASNLVAGSSVVSDAEVDDNLTISAAGSVAAAAITGTLTDAQVSDTLTASNLVASSSVVSDAEVDDNLTISGGTVNGTPIGAVTASTGAFTTVTASTSAAIGGGTAITRLVFGTCTVDPPNITNNNTGTATVTTTSGCSPTFSAATTDILLMMPPSTIENLIFLGANVTAADTITLKFANESGGAINGAALTWSFLVLR